MCVEQPGRVWDVSMHFWKRAEFFFSAMILRFLFFNRSGAPVAKTQDGLWLWVRWSPATPLLPSQRNSRVDTAWLPPLPFSVVISVKPHAGSNEQYAGEGIFFNPAQGLIEQPRSSSADAKCSCQQLHALLLPTFTFLTPSLSYVCVSISPIPLFPSVLTIHLDSSSTASYYELRSNNLGGWLEVTAC